MKIMKCLICEQDIEIDDNDFVMGGGKVSFDFGYGSGKYDAMCLSYATTHDERMASPDIKVDCFIHDECFKKKSHLMKGYKIIYNNTTYEEIPNE